MLPRSVVIMHGVFVILVVTMQPCNTVYLLLYGFVPLFLFVLTAYYSAVSVAHIGVAAWLTWLQGGCTV